MQNKIITIVGSGSTDISQLKHYAAESDAVIACDGGMGHCRKAGIVPDVIIGDFDSAKPDDKKYFESQNIEFLTYPTHKDMTDSEIGINLALDRGAERLFLLGLSGTRLDHTITNINLLMLPLKKGVRAELADKNNIVSLTDGDIEIEGKKGDNVSLIPLTTSVTGVTTKGLEYPLCNAEMHIGGSLGVSNVMLGDRAGVSVENGVLIVIKSKD